MTGRQGNNALCAFCGGRTRQGVATVPFVLGKAVAIVRDAPAFICENCDEPFMTSHTTDIVTKLLSRLQSLGAELSVVSYADEANEALLPH